MRQLNVLVSGAGIAGCTLAYWLARHGHSATVVERGGGIRSSGAPVDIRGSAMQVVEDMGLVPQLQAASTNVTGIGFRITAKATAGQEWHGVAYIDHAQIRGGGADNPTDAGPYPYGL